MVLDFSISWHSFWGSLFTVTIAVCLRDFVHLSPGCRADAAFAVAKEGRQWETHNKYKLYERGLRKTIKCYLTKLWMFSNTLRLFYSPFPLTCLWGRRVSWLHQIIALSSQASLVWDLNFQCILLSLNRSLMSLPTNTAKINKMRRKEL